MKTLLFAGLALAGFSAGTFAQGSFDFNLSSFANGVAWMEPVAAGGQWYSGPLGIEVWELNAATVPAGFNTLPGDAAYEALTAYGFKHEQTYANMTIDTGSIVLKYPV